VVSKNEFDWNQFHAYQAFDRFINEFLINRKSAVTTHSDVLDLESALDDIEERFVGGYDDSKQDFEAKVKQQFNDASINTKLVFANVEYLWSMPVENISARKKKAYVERWFKGQVIADTEQQAFFNYPHTIANPGSWYLRNKYNELLAIFRLIAILHKENALSNYQGIKSQLAMLCHQAIYDGIEESSRFSVSVVCGVHNAIMHMSNPYQYESIISEGHKKKIVDVFEHLIPDFANEPDREVKIQVIRERLEKHYLHEDGEVASRRWLFYSAELKHRWVGKKTKRDRLSASISDQLQLEQDALDLPDSENKSHIEGESLQTTGYRLTRSAKLVAKVKRRDGYACLACGFYFQKKIVHVHHLDPLSERKTPKKTKKKDLVTLCPNCHSVAHFLLRESNKYKRKEVLLAKLKQLQ